MLTIHPLNGKDPAACVCQDLNGFLCHSEGDRDSKRILRRGGLIECEERGDFGNLPMVWFWDQPFFVVFSLIDAISSSSFHQSCVRRTH